MDIKLSAFMSEDPDGLFDNLPGPAKAKARAGRAVTQAAGAKVES